jgi:RNA polymerase sigma-70 factor (ECF subfamily)
VNTLDELMLAARDGNRLALDRVTRETLPAVQKLCWHLGDPDTVEDLVQETYARMMRSLPRYRGDGSARSWLLRIARNTCADSTRARRRARTRTSFTELPDVADAPASGWSEVTSVLAGLDPDRRHAFVLTQILNLPYQEAADVLGCPIGTVRSRVARARDDLLTAERDEQFVAGVGEAQLRP